MGKIKKLTLDDFLKNVQDHKNKELKKADIFIKELGGSIEFSRPNNEEMLRYMNKEASCFSFGPDGEIKEMNIEMKVENAKEFLFNTCAFLRDPKTQETLNIKDPLDAAIEVFGIDNISDIASMVDETFKVNKVARRIVEQVKN